MTPEQEQQIGRCILRDAHDAFLIVHPGDLRIVEANPAAQRLTGFRHNELLNMALADLFEAERQQELEELICACRDTSCLTANSGFALKTQSGGKAPVFVTVSRIHVAPDPLALLVLRDFQREKHTQEALRESEHRYRSVVEGSLQGILIHQDACIVYANQALARMFDYDHPRELIGRPLWKTFVVSEHFTELQERTRAILAGASIPPHPGWRAVGKTGRSIWVSTTASLIDWHGRPAVVAFYLDVTERSQAEESANASRRMLQMILDNIPQGVFWKDRQSRYLGCNRVVADAFGFPNPQALVGLTDHQVSCLTREQADFFVVKDRQVMATNIPELGIIEPATLADGRSIWMETSKIPMHDDSGNVIGVLGTWQDISERIRAEEERRKLDAQLQHTQKLESLGVLAGGIAHDFNNLLTSILGYADLALMELPPQSSTRHLLEEVIDGARRAAELTNQMLAYSGKGRFIVQPTDLSEIVESVRRLLQVSISKKCVLQCHLSPGLPAIEADSAQLRQVVMNLIINASEAIGDNSGLITVRTSTEPCSRADLARAHLGEFLDEGNYVCLQVADNGAGMSQETVAKIFDPFFTTKFTGRGLGLAAVLGIVRGHRGAIQVTSELGKGTTFKVMLPSTAQPAASAAPREPSAAGWRCSGNVLVVDDEESVRNLSQHMLQSMGFTVVTAADGREAIELFGRDSHQFALVLLDMTMPHLNGAETFREMRRLRGDARAILISGYSQQTATSQFAGQGLAGFLQKPFSYADLMGVVRNALAQEKDYAI